MNQPSTIDEKDAIAAPPDQFRERSVFLKTPAGNNGGHFIEEGSRFRPARQGGVGTGRTCRPSPQ